MFTRPDVQQTSPGTELGTESRGVKKTSHLIISSRGVRADTHKQVVVAYVMSANTNPGPTLSGARLGAKETEHTWAWLLPRRRSQTLGQVGTGSVMTTGCLDNIQRACLTCGGVQGQLGQEEKTSRGGGGSLSLRQERAGEGEARLRSGTRVGRRDNRHRGVAGG